MFTVRYTLLGHECSSLRQQLQGASCLARLSQRCTVALQSNTHSAKPVMMLRREFMTGRPTCNASLTNLSGAWASLQRRNQSEVDPTVQGMQSFAWDCGRSDCCQVHLWLLTLVL